MAQDPVCKMDVDAQKAAATAAYRRTDLLFLPQHVQRDFRQRSGEISLEKIIQTYSLVLHRVGMRGSEPGGRRRRGVEVGAGPDLGSNHPKGLAWEAFKPPIYRLRPEGLFPRLPTYLERLY